MKQIILQRDSHQIRWEQDKIKEELGKMQNWIDWYNDLPYTEPITTLEAAKAFLTNTEGFHDKQVITFLKTKVSELPPSLKPLREMWEIEDCENANFSGSALWPVLECKDGKLSVPDSVFNEVEQRFTHVATPEQAAALAELDRIHSGLQAINEIINPMPGISRDLFSRDSAQLLDKLTYRKPLLGRDPGMLVKWDIAAITKLAENGFGQKKVKVTN